MKCHITSSVLQTTLLNVYRYTTGLCKAKAEFKPEQHLPKKHKEIFTTLPATVQGPPFPRLLWEAKQKKTLDQAWRRGQDADGRSVPANLDTWVFALRSCHHAVDFSRPSAQITDGQPGTLLFAASRSLVQNMSWIWASQPRPRGAPPCWELLREQHHPFAPRAKGSPGPRQERGEAAPESTAGAFPFPLMSHWGVVGVISRRVFFCVFLVCLAKSKRPGLTQPKLYQCPCASRFLTGCFWVSSSDGVEAVWCWAKTAWSVA